MSQNAVSSLFPRFTTPTRFRPLRTLTRDLDRLLDEFADMNPDVDVMAKIDLRETPEAIEIKADMPGVNEEDVDLTITGDLVSISAQRGSEADAQEGGWHVMERTKGSFSRAFSLGFVPEDDAVEANLENGVLNVRVRKPEALATASRKIPLKNGE